MYTTQKTRRIFRVETGIHGGDQERKHRAAPGVVAANRTKIISFIMMMMMMMIIICYHH
jgi:hypothetical protein